MAATIEWLGHATFRLKNGATVYIDPWKIEGDPEKADLLLLSHNHYDHFVVEDIEKVRTADTVVLASTDCARELKGNVMAIQPGDTHTVGDIIVRATAAYNTDKEFHPKSNNWLGFLITMGGERIYFAGDTDVISEMSQLGGVDVALLPVGGTYTMGPSEAAEAASIINPGRCIPYHYGDIVGSLEDAKRFKNLCTCRTDILEPQA